MAGRFEHQEADGGDYGGASGVQDALEGVDTEDVGLGDVVLAGDEQGANGFRDASEKEEGAEAGQVHAVDAPETGRAHMGLELLPAEGAYRIAEVDDYKGEEEVEEVGVTDGLPEFLAAE